MELVGGMLAVGVEIEMNRNIYIYIFVMSVHVNSALPAGHWAEQVYSKKNLFKRGINLPVITLSLREQTVTNIA